MKYLKILTAALLSLLFISAAIVQFEAPKGLPPVPWPEDNPYTEQKAELGRILYFDKRLSSDGTVSCSSCHQVQRAFADHRSISTGVHGRLGKRHAPTLINCAYNSLQFWDGRADSLEAQCKGPISNPLEMTTLTDSKEALDACAKRINQIAGYRPLFKEAFGHEEATIDDIAKAISTFERTIFSYNSAHDRFVAGDKTAMTKEQIHGMKLYNKSGCANCHYGPNLTDGKFTNIGVGMDAKEPDLGRYEVTKAEKDWGAFKVPTLRDVSHTAPYMHDGSLKTLEEVVDFYDKGGIPNKNLHPQIRELNLTVEEKKALVAFLKAFDGEGWQHFAPPKHFPQ